MSDPSPEYTVTFHEGTADVLRAIMDKLAESHDFAINNATDFETLAGNLRNYAELLGNHVNTLHEVLTCSRRGNVHLFPDPERPLSFTFNLDSGYNGGLIFWPLDNRWQIHT